MPNPVALGVALFVGGATIAPALTVENTLVGRITPAAMHNEAYTWVITISIAASALGGAVAGYLVDVGFLGLAFVCGAAALAVGALVTAWPSGAIARADARSKRMRSTPRSPIGRRDAFGRRPYAVPSGRPDRCPR